ncbi:MAG: hypothetical protein HY805_09410 [Nitrospirae bacterium]|nr:hypothetical protein [Nitrospirota bacterium]
MRKIIYIITVAVLAFLPLNYSYAYEDELKDLSQLIADNMGKIGRKRVAVADFGDLKGNAMAVGSFLSDELSTKLKGIANGFEVLERSEFKSILTQQKLSISVPYESAVVKKIGTEAKVGAIVIGTVENFEKEIRVSIDLINTYTGKVIASKTIDIAKTKRIVELIPVLETVPTKTIGETKGVQTIASQRIEDFVFEFEGCDLSRQTVTCSVNIINKAHDRRLTLFGSSRILDSEGNEYTARTIQLGGEGGSYAAVNTLILDVAMKATFSSEEVLKKINQVAVLELSFKLGENPFKVQFRNIPLSIK